MLLNTFLLSVIKPETAGVIPETPSANPEIAGATQKSSKVLKRV